MSKNPSPAAPPTTPMPNRNFAQWFADLLQQALSLELDAVLEAVQAAASCTPAAPPTQTGIAGTAEWTQLLAMLEECRRDWNAGSIDPIDSGLLAKALDIASTYLTTTGEAHPYIAADTIDDANKKIARTRAYLNSAFLANKDRRARSVRAARTFHLALTTWINRSGDAELTKLAIELRGIDADWSAESRRSVNTVLKQLDLAVVARASLDRLAQAEIECETARQAIAVWQTQLDTLLAVSDDSAAPGNGPAQAMLGWEYERRSYSEKELADLIQRLRKQFLQKARIDADLMAQLSVDSAEEAAKNLSNAADGPRRANDDLDQHAQRMSHAPLSSASSFQQWRDSRNEILDVIEKRLDQSAKTLASLGGFGEQLIRFLQLEATLEGKDSPVRRHLDSYQQLKKEHEDERAYGRIDGLSLCEILRDEMNRLEASHAALPIMPADWSKPAGHALMLFIAGVLTYVLFGAGLLRQPLWNVFGAGDAADLLFHPAYFFGVALLIIWTSAAARDVPKKHAERALKRLQQARRGNRHVSDQETPLMQFTKQVDTALRTSLAVVTVGVGACWILAAHVGGMAYTVAPKTECRADTRVYAFSRGFVAVGPGAQESYLVYTKDPAAYLCGKAMFSPATTSLPPPAKIALELPEGVTTSLSALSELKSLSALKDGASALKDAGTAQQEGAAALKDSAEALKTGTLALGKISDALLSRTGNTTSLRISASVQELKECQQKPDSPTCIMQPLTAAVAALDGKMKLLTDGMPAMKTALEATATHTKVLTDTKKDIADLLAEWREAKARNFFTLVRDKVVGNKKEATTKEATTKNDPPGK